MEPRERGEAPKITTAEDLLARLRQGVKDVHQIELRGTVIPVRVLSADEMNRIRQEALKDTAISGGDETDKNLRVQKNTLILASTVPVGSGPMLAERVLGMLSVDEITFLFEQYIHVLDRVNPSLETISTEEFQALVVALKKKSISTRDLSLRQLRGTCYHFVAETPLQETAS